MLFHIFQLMDQKGSFFNICFGVSFWLLNFVSRNFNIDFCLCRRNFEFESEFSDLEVESIINLELILILKILM